MHTSTAGMEPRTPRHAPSPLALLAVAALSLHAATCANRRSDGRPPPPPRLSPVSVARDGGGAAPLATTRDAQPRPPPDDGACSLGTAGGTEVTAVRGRIDHLQLAAWGDQARVVVDVGGGRATRAFAVDLDAQAVPSGPAAEVTTGARGVRTVAAVAPFRGALRTLAISARRSARASDGYENAYRFVLDGGDPAAAAPRSLASAYGVFEGDEVVGGGDGASLFAVAAGTRLECAAPVCESAAGDRGGVAGTYDSHEAFSVHAVIPDHNGLATREIYRAPCADVPQTPEPGEPAYLVEPDETGRAPHQPPSRCFTEARYREGRADAVALAFHPQHPAVAFRTGGRALHVVVLDAEGRATAPLRQVATGEVGAPALAYRGETLVMVWAQRESPRAPFALRYVEWADAARTPGAAPAAVSTLQITGGASAFAPSLAVQGGRTVLAWMEGTDRAAVVRVGASYRGLAHVAEHAITASTPAGNARDPAVAWTDRGGWFAWAEYPAGRSFAGGGGQVRVASLMCP